MECRRCELCCVKIYIASESIKWFIENRLSCRFSLSQFSCVLLVELTGKGDGGGWGSYNGQKAWSSINHSTLSVLLTPQKTSWRAADKSFFRRSSQEWRSFCKFFQVSSWNFLNISSAFLEHSLILSRDITYRWLLLWKVFIIKYYSLQWSKLKEICTNNEISPIELWPGLLMPYGLASSLSCYACQSVEG
jgi:hypothetical protein